MGRKLAAAVHVTDPETRKPVAFVAGSEPPAWAVPLITNPAAWGKAAPEPAPFIAPVDTAPAPEAGPEIPAAADYGSGSLEKRTKPQLEALAASKDVDITGAKNKAAIAAALRAAGVEG